MTQLETKDGIEYKDARFGRQLLGLTVLAVLSCCVTSGILLAHQDEISKIFLSLSGGN